MPLIILIVIITEVRHCMHLLCRSVFEATGCNPMCYAVCPSFFLCMHCMHGRSNPKSFRTSCGTKSRPSLLLVLQRVSCKMRYFPLYCYIFFKTCSRGTLWRAVGVALLVCGTRACRRGRWPQQCTPVTGASRLRGGVRVWVGGTTTCISVPTGQRAHFF